ncbi:MAG TPA: prepilin peptidase [Patescibacteria group bacterium]|nr:prepilin peptidase [Patescibacteria group bacterium]
MIILLLILFGLAFGSFVNALVWRLHSGQDWVRGRSECSRCHHPLAAKDLIPVLSWVILRGKCRYCHKRITDNPLAELLVPALFVVSYLAWPPLSGQALFDFVFWLIFIIGFTALALYDLKWFLLPDVIIFPLVALAFLQVAGDWLLFDHSWRMLPGPAIGAAVISGIFYFLYAVSKGKWIGFGDVKLAIILGLLAGSAMKSLLVMLIASLAGTFIALPMVIQGKADRKSHLPFGPLLIVGMIIVQLWGSGIINWYTGLFSV